MTVAAAVAGAVVAALLTLPLAWKWQLGMRRTILGLSVILILAAAVAVAVGAGVGLSAAARALLAAALTLLAAFAVLAYRFYRDPARTPPGGDDVVVSPADGVIVYVKSSQDGRLPLACKRGHQVVARGADTDSGARWRGGRRRDRHELPRRARQPRSDRRQGPPAAAISG